MKKKIEIVWPQGNFTSKDALKINTVSSITLHNKIHEAVNSKSLKIVERRASGGRGRPTNIYSIA